MNGLKISLDPEEILYAKEVAAKGRDLSIEGKNIYTTSRMKLVKDLPGVVILGCVVETEKKRLGQGTDQDFGHIKIMFYVLFSEHQAEIIKRMFPEMSIHFIEHEKREALILNWIEYREALGKR